MRKQTPFISSKLQNSYTPTKVTLGHIVRFGIVRVAFCNLLTYTPRQSHEIFVAIPFVTLMRGNKTSD